MQDVALGTDSKHVPATTAIVPLADAADRAIDVALGLWLAVFPLLPAGPHYLGVAASWWPEAALLPLGGLALTAVLNTARHAGLRSSAPGWSREARLVSWGYGYWLVAVTGAAAVGLATENAIGWTPFAFHLAELPGRLFQPMNQATDPLHPIRVWLTMVEGAIAFWITTFILTNCRQPRCRTGIAIAGCLTGTALVSLIALIQYCTRAGLHPYWVFMNPHLTRSHATLEDPNALGSFLLLGVGLAVGMVWSSHSGWAGRRRQLAAASIAILGVCALVTTVSRAAWAAGPLAVVTVVAMRPRQSLSTAGGRRARLAAQLVFVSVAVLLAAWLVARMVVLSRPVTRPAGVWQAMVQTVDPRTPIADVLKNRHLMWQTAGGLFAERSVLGIGLGRFPGEYGRGPHGQPPENAHNFFLQTAAEMGFVGVVCLGLLIGSMVAAIQPYVCGSRRRAAGLASGLAMGLLAWLLTSLTGHPLLTVSNQVWLGSVLAVGLAALQMTPAGWPPPGTFSRRRPCGVPLKRALDLTLASVLLLLSAPLLVLIALSIRLDSPGPVFFRHERVTTTRGRAGRRSRSEAPAPRVFSLIKFRTMRHGVDPYAPSPVNPRDPRVTRLGRVLRRTCLDELPQLWNVVRGDLSLVGPRPEMPWIVQAYDEKARRRLHVQPGVTGLWQLRGRRDRSIHHDLRWDLVYLGKRSLALDIAILLETVRFVMSRRNL